MSGRAVISISKYHKDILAAFRNDLKKVSVRYTPEGIHQLRLDIKRIRALYQLLEAIKSGKFNANAKASCFKGVFKQAGEIRARQVDKLRVRKLKLPTGLYSSYIRYINNEIRNNRYLLEIHLNSFDQRNIMLNEIAVNILTRTIAKKKLQGKGLKFISKRCKKIIRLNANKAHNSSLHKMRKYIKEVSSVAALLHKINPSFIGKDFIKDMKTIGEKIGIWHDNGMLIESIEDFIKNENGLTKKEIAISENAVGKIEKRNDKMAKKLRQVVKHSLMEYLTDISG